MNSDTTKPFFISLVSRHTIDGILLMACHYEKKCGYESQKMLEDGTVKTTTKQRVKDYFSLADHADDFDSRITELVTLYQDKVDDIKVSISDLPVVEPTDRMYNYFNDMRTLFRVEDTHLVNPNQIGMIVSALGLYNAKPDEDSNSKHLGVVGKGGEWFVKLVKYRRLDNGSNQYSVVNRVGDKGIFYSKHIFELDLGDCFLFQGTVKKHDVWRGVNTTHWNYVKIKENVGKVQ